MAVKAGDLISIAKRALYENGIYEIEKVQITYREKRDSEWRVNISYDKGGRPEVANLCIDAETGEVTYFKEGWVWK